ncbi:MAG: hypothetical protein JWM73_1973 [Solirubrobacterales bacterium]|nr:hypothetical protein [Solirubrobacterales bacterium]
MDLVETRSTSSCAPEQRKPRRVAIQVGDEPKTIEA